MQNTSYREVPGQDGFRASVAACRPRPSNIDIAAFSADVLRPKVRNQQRSATA